MAFIQEIPNKIRTARMRNRTDAIGTHMGFIIHACWFNLITFPGDVNLISAYMIFARFDSFAKSTNLARLPGGASLAST